MIHTHPPSRPASTPFFVRTAGTAALLALLGACGGGTTDGDAGPAAAALSAGDTATAQSRALSAYATSRSGDAGGGDSTPQHAGLAETVGTAHALGAAASVILGGLTDAPPPAPALPPAAGRSFHINSKTGNDTNDGRSAATSGAGRGPWKSLARVLLSDLGPGDALELACGSEWRETLRVPASGTVGQPVQVRTPAGGCAAARPTIDGSVDLPAKSWALYQGKIYRTSLDGAPLQLFAAGGHSSVAHHPNRGYLAANPATPYLALAADGDIVEANGRSGSSTLSSGSDLVLPAGAQLTAGLRVRVRANSWTLDERTLSAVQGKQLRLDSMTSFPVLAGWGYFLTGALWMLDSPGEWHHDAGTKTLYAWMPDSSKPVATVRATVLATGIDLAFRQHVVVDGIAVRRTGTGIDLRQSNAVQVRNSVVEDSAGVGIDVTASTAATIESSLIARSGTDGIGNGADLTPPTRLVARNNVVRESGVLMQDETAVDLPTSSRAAIVGGLDARVSGNVVANAGHNGIHVRSDSIVENNFVYGTCSVLDDCGGIYTWNSSGVAVRGNTVLRTRGAAHGKPAATAFTQGHGIFLDESTSGGTVQDNTVIDSDNGIQLHVAHDNVLRDNRLYANRTSGVRMRESRNQDHPQGDLYGNLVEGNQIAAVYSQSSGLLLETIFATTRHFGQFDHNRYYDRTAATITYETTANGMRAFSLPLWQQSNGVGSVQAVDANGSGVSAGGFASYAVSGGNLVPNSGLVQHADGWTHWNALAPSGQLVRDECPSGPCLRYAAGGSNGLVASAGFAVQKDHWYRISVDLVVDADDQPLQVRVRRVGADGNGYESIAPREMTVTAGRQWKRHTLLFQSTRTLVVGDPVTGDLGARIDVSAIPAGRTVSIANVELVRIVPDTLAQTSLALVNASATARAMTCPFTGSQSSLCANFNTLVGDQPVAWPMSVPPHGATIVYAQVHALRDSDRDGIADVHDRCPGTPPSVPVNAGGCAWPMR